MTLIILYICWLAIDKWESFCFVDLNESWVVDCQCKWFFFFFLWFISCWMKWIERPHSFTNLDSYIMVFFSNFDYFVYRGLPYSLTRLQYGTMFVYKALYKSFKRFAAKWACQLYCSIIIAFGHVHSFNLEDSYKNYYSFYLKYWRVFCLTVEKNDLLHSFII